MDLFEKISQLCDRLDRMPQESIPAKKLQTLVKMAKKKKKGEKIK